MIRNELDEASEIALGTFVRARMVGEAPSIADFVASHPKLLGPLQSRLGALEAFEELVDRSGLVSAPWQATAPAHIGGYRLLRALGRGGMGTVYLAESPRDEQVVALKLLDAATAGAGLVGRFQREAELATRLRHPNLVRVYESGVDQQYVFYAMEYVPGITLAELLDRARARQLRGEPLDADAIVREALTAMGELVDEDFALIAPRRGSFVSQVTRWIAEVADALLHLHTNGILHRDVKPANIMIDAALQPRLVDFGLAREAGQGSGTVGMLGTLDYMSPEMVLEGARGSDHRGDIYSLGATLYELVTLRRVNQRKGFWLAVKQSLEAAPVQPRSLAPELPQDLQTVILRALEVEPRHRYGTAGEFADDLRRVLRFERPNARPVSFWRRGRRFAARHRLALVVGIALLAVVAVTAVLLARDRWRRRDLLTQGKEQILAGRFDEARASLGAALAFYRDEDTEELVRNAEGVFSVPLRGMPAGCLVEVGRLDEVSGVVTELERFTSTGRDAPRLRTGNYRVTVVQPGTALAEQFVSVQRDAARGIDVVLRPTRDVVNDMVLIPAGVYPLGYARGPQDERTPLDLGSRGVELAAYYIDRTEVSNGEYLAFVRATGVRPPWRGPAPAAGDERKPVHGVSWYEAVAYAEWAGKRLPSQDEWEAAARGTAGLVYPWGNEFAVTRANLRPSLTDRSPPVCAVDQRNDDVSPFGVLHLVGNVREWVFDPWVPRVSDLPEEPWQFPTGRRVLKGSSVHAPPSYVGCRSSARTYGSPDKVMVGVGFRCAKSARP